MGAGLLSLMCALLYLVVKGLGEVTNIDDPLDDKFWKDKV